MKTFAQLMSAGTSDLNGWKRHVDKQHPRWKKVNVLEPDKFHMLERCALRGFFGDYTEEFYWQFVKSYAQSLNDESKTGYIVPDSEQLQRWQTDSYYLKCIDNGLYHKPTYEAFWFDSYRYTGQVAAFFDLGNNLYQSLLIRTREYERKYIGALLVTFSKTRPHDFHCPKIHLVIQDGEYKK